MNSGPAGFYNAPVTKFIVISSGALSLLASSRAASSMFSLAKGSLIRRFEFWRLISSNLMFQSSPEAIFGLYLIYFFRVFERRLGSNKYSVLVLFSCIIATALQLGYLMFSKDVEDQLLLSPGPYGLIFSLFVPFFFDIPASTRFSVFGVNFSDKSFVYLAGLQLLLSSWKRSAVPGICGLLSGILYRTGILGIHSAKFPESIAAAAERLFGPLMSRAPSSAPTRAADAVHGSRPLPPPSESFRDQLVGAGPSVNNLTRLTASTPPLATLAPPSEEAISTLEAMGFDRADALRALAYAQNDLILASNFLIESHS